MDINSCLAREPGVSLFWMGEEDAIDVPLRIVWYELGVVSRVSRRFFM